MGDDMNDRQVQQIKNFAQGVTTVKILNLLYFPSSPVLDYSRIKIELSGRVVKWMRKWCHRLKKRFAMFIATEV